MFVASGLLGSAPADAAAELSLKAGYRLVNDKAAISSDGLRLVGLELKPASLERFSRDCAALPALTDEPDAKLSRTMGPKKLKGSGVVCAMVIHRRDDEQMLAVSVAWPRRGPDAAARIKERLELSILYDGVPDAWSDKQVLADAKRLARKVKDRGGDEVAIKIADWEGDRLPALPLDCGAGITLPRGWRLAPHKLGDPAELKMVLKEQRGHKREARVAVLPNIGVDLQINSMKKNAPQARTWKTPNGQRHLDITKGGQKLHVIYDPLPCDGKVMMLVVTGYGGRRTRQWSGAGVSRVLGAHMKPAGDVDAARLMGSKPHPPSGGSTAKEAKLAARWVKKLSGARGRHYDSRFADRSGGSAADGYSVGGSTSTLRFCPTGTFEAHTHSEMHVTTPYGSVSDSSDERLYGTWGVFSFGGVPMLFLWSQKATNASRWRRGDATSPRSIWPTVSSPSTP